MKRLFLVDAYALIFRFYYAFISRPMRNSTGLNTSAIYGFTKFINDIMSKEQPNHLGVAFDLSGGTFRNELYPLYKANRAETPEDIILSTPHIKRILEAMHIPILEMKGYEADDIIGTIAKKAACNDFEVFMVTPDKDYGQLITDCIHMYKPAKSGKGIEIVSKQDIKDHYGTDNPELIIDILALWGDASDNIPGVPGIGEKTAIKLINQYGDIEKIIEAAPMIKGKQGVNILENIEQLRLSKVLATIDLNVPIEYSPEKLKVKEPDYKLLRELYHEMNFTSLTPTIDFWERANGKTSTSTPITKIIAASQPEPSKNIQQSLFGDVETPQTAMSSEQTTPQATATANRTPSLFDEVELSLENISHQYKAITTTEELDQLIAMLSIQKEISFDTETTNLNPLLADLVGISFSVEQYKAYYIPTPVADVEATKNIVEKLRPIFENSNIAKIGQNIKYDLLVLKNYNIAVKGVMYDTMIIDSLLDSDQRHGMDYMAERYLSYKTIPISDLIGKGMKQITMDKVDLEKVMPYACEDADVTLQLYHLLWSKAKQQGLDKLYLEVEEPLIRVLTDMEYAGVKLDKEALDEYAQELNAEMNKTSAAIYELAGEEVNINSPKQLGELLFNRLKITEKPKMTKTKQYKTDEETLTALRDKHPVIDLILEYRSLKKLLSTYVEALPLLINPKTGRIHTTYNQAGTSTGRLSSNNPNLQNIPIRDERGKRIRKAFVAEGDDKVILAADYSQVELRIMAALSKDSSMIEAFNSGEDIHTATAAKIFGVSISEVTSSQRRQAKSANFGIIYGISVFGLSTRLLIGRKEASELIDGYFAHYPQVKEYMDQSIIEGRELGYSSTMFGRRKYLADINSPNGVVRGYAERNAINAPIQGSAADIIKIAMSRLHTALTDGGFKSRLILQVHDELVLEVDKSELDEVTKMVVTCMENVMELPVKLVAEYGSATSWLEAH